MAHHARSGVGGDVAARIGETLENQFAEIVETQPHLMAQHCFEAGHFERAINYWLKAGQQAVSRSAMPEAEALLRKGLALAIELGSGTACCRTGRTVRSGLRP